MLGRSRDCFAPLHQQSGICCSFFTFLVFKPWLQCNVIIDTGEKLIHCNFIRKTSGRGLFVGACPVFQACWQLLLWLFIRYQKGCRVLAAEHTVCRCAAIVTEPKQSRGWKIAGRHWSNSTDWCCNSSVRHGWVLALSIQSCVVGDSTYKLVTCMQKQGRF